jgi:hypothetical protein
MNIEKTINDLADQNSKVAETLKNYSEIMIEFKKILFDLREVTLTNEYLISFILKDKLDMTRTEVNQLITDTKTKIAKDTEEILKIEKLFEM